MPPVPPCLSNVTLYVAAVHALALDAPDDADPQGIKEKAAMDFEKYGGVRVVKVERVEEYQQMTMEGD